MEKRALRSGTAIVAIITVFIFGAGILLRSEQQRYLSAQSAAPAAAPVPNVQLASNSESEAESSPIATSEGDVITKDGILYHVYDHRIFKLVSKNSDGEVLVITKAPLTTEQQIELAGFLDGTTDGFTVTGIERVVKLDDSESDIISSIPNEFHASLKNQRVIIADSIDIPKTSIVIN